jgi:DNA primase large subunit
LGPEEREEFLRQNQLDIERVGRDEQDALSLYLGSNGDASLMFKAPFERVPDLVGRREVYLRDGIAYVPHSGLISVLVSDYKRSLMRSLEVAAKSLPRLDEDDRLKPLLVNMSRQYLGKEFGADGKKASGKVTADQVDKLVEHFPPCMRHLHMQLHKDQHLKHNGRMQFGLFLKGIGLSMEDALLYWRRAFGKLSDDKFNKQYAYNIRHNYGREGNRVNYTPYSCVKVIMGNGPSHGDNHGCPFKHFSKDNLAAMLRSHGLGDMATRDVVELSKQGHYQVACTKYFEITRGKLILMVC